MGGKFRDWDKFHRSIKSAEGLAATPFYNKKDELPTKKQIDYIEFLLKDLSDHGIDASWCEQIAFKDWRTSSKEAWYLTRKLVWVRYSHGIRSDADVTYVNLCKNRETGEKIRYRTGKRFAAPKGYDFIGQISKEVKFPDAM